MMIWHLSTKNNFQITFSTQQVCNVSKLCKALREIQRYLVSWIFLNNSYSPSAAWTIGISLKYIMHSHWQIKQQFTWILRSDLMSKWPRNVLLLEQANTSYEGYLSVIDLLSFSEKSDTTIKGTYMKLFSPFLYQLFSYISH